MPDAHRQCFRPKAGYMLERIDDELLIYHPNEAMVIYCNTTAALVWQLCDGERSTAQIISLIAESFPEQRSAIERDVTNALAHLHAHHALETVQLAQAATPAS